MIEHRRRHLDNVAIIHTIIIDVNCLMLGRKSTEVSNDGSRCMYYELWLYNKMHHHVR